MDRLLHHPTDCRVTVQVEEFAAFTTVLATSTGKGGCVSYGPPIEGKKACEIEPWNGMELHRRSIIHSGGIRLPMTSDDGSAPMKGELKKAFITIKVRTGARLNEPRARKGAV